MSLALLIAVSGIGVLVHVPSGSAAEAPAVKIASAQRTGAKNERVLEFMAAPILPELRATRYGTSGLRLRS
jgi:hypothetical protein